MGFSERTGWLSMTEAGRIKFEGFAGPCKGDWCKVKTGGQDRIAHVDAAVIKLADSTGSFSLDDSGAVGYTGGFGRTIPRSSLGKALHRRERGLFNGVQWVNCRVFEEK
jgi:hypothetical protein